MRDRLGFETDGRYKIKEWLTIIALYQTTSMLHGADIW